MLNQIKNQADFQSICRQAIQQKQQKTKNNVFNSIFCLFSHYKEDETSIKNQMHEMPSYHDNQEKVAI